MTISVPLPLRDSNVDLAAQRANVAANHVHADAASGDVAERVRGAEAGHEHELPYLVVGHAVVHGEPQQLRLAQNLVAIEAAAVVFDRDHHIAGLMGGFDADRAVARFTGSLAYLGCFDAVVDAVAHEMRERIGELFDHFLVELGLAAARNQVHLFAEPLRQVAHQPRHARKQHFQRQQAHAHDGILQLAGLAADVAHALTQARIFGRTAAFAGLREHRMRNHELADQVQQAVDLVDVHPDRRAIQNQPIGRAPAESRRGRFAIAGAPAAGPPEDRGRFRRKRTVLRNLRTDRWRQHARTRDARQRLMRLYAHVAAVEQGAQLVAYLLLACGGQQEQRQGCCAFGAVPI